MSRHLSVRQSRILIMLLGVMVVIAMGFVLKVTQPVVLPLLVAWLLAQLLGPMVTFLVRKKAPPALAIGFVLILLLVAVYWTIVFLAAGATSFVSQLPMYRSKFAMITSDLFARLNTEWGSVSNAALNQEINKQLSLLFGKLLGMAGGLLQLLAGLVTKSLMVFIILAFMLFGKQYSGLKIEKAFAPDMAERVRTVVQSISRKLSHYLRTQLIISLITGLLVWLTCRIVGIGSPVTWGTLAFFLNFIPTIGSILAAIPPILLALLQFYPNGWPAIATGVSILVINQILGNVITPKVMGDKLNLSPVVVLLSVLFWGWLWGVVGALLSVLIASAIQIVCEQIEVLRPIGVLMASGRSLERASRS